MGNILEEIAAKTRERVAKQKEQVSLENMIKQAKEAVEELPKSRQGYPFYQALKKPGLSFICEVKKASPSKGIIAEHFPYVEIAREYEAAGADAMSILTEPYYFKGSGQYLQEIRQVVDTPLLRKDFVVDAYQIYEARVLGADAVLLICAILTDEQLSEYGAIAASLGLSALVEAHDEEEVKRAMAAGAKIIGVNNRDLRNFTVDIQNSVRLRSLVPEEILFVSESGIKTAQDTKTLRENGTNAVLIGETFMRSENKAEMLNTLRQ